jgi:hypothetical protein
MVKTLLGTTLLIAAMAGPASGQGSLTPHQGVEQQNIKLPGTDYRIILGVTELQKPNSPSRQNLLTAIETWLSVEFDLAPVHHHPQIELVPAAKIVALRYKGIVPAPHTNFAPDDRGTLAAQRETLAIYSDAAQTIYLPEGWTSGTPAELSVLVHELVHHAQNLLGLKYHCPQEREQLAYVAQERWLGLFGRSLASEFELDPLTLLVKTKCFH